MPCKTRDIKCGTVGNNYLMHNFAIMEETGNIYCRIYSHIFHGKR
uniref:Uncharacterized protein n=1 Tax=Anguilla anguilla TaxID=7936 RepID=A0A0E9W2G7_ANGAN